MKSLYPTVVKSLVFNYFWINSVNMKIGRTCNMRFSQYEIRSRETEEFIAAGEIGFIVKTRGDFELPL